MTTFDLDTFTNRVDQTTTDKQLTTLQQEFSDHVATLSEPDRQTLVQAYIIRMNERRQSIANQLRELRDEKVSA